MTTRGRPFDCDLWPGCGCLTQSGPSTCEGKSTIEAHMKLNQAHMKACDGIEAQYGLNDVWPGDEYPMINMIELHKQMTGHLFPAFASEDERFLALALCGEVGELANMIKKRWRDGVRLEDEIRDELADIRVYLELLAYCFGVEGAKLDAQVQSKLERVAARFSDRIKLT